jgi:hypothetical protein
MCSPGHDCYEVVNFDEEKEDRLYCEVAITEGAYHRSGKEHFVVEGVEMLYLQAIVGEANQRTTSWTQRTHANFLLTVMIRRQNLGQVLFPLVRNSIFED